MFTWEKNDLNKILIVVYNPDIEIRQMSFNPYLNKLFTVPNADLVKAPSVRAIHKELRQFAGVNTDSEFRRFKRSNGVAGRELTSEQAYALIARQRNEQNIAAAFNANVAYYERKTAPRPFIPVDESTPQRPINDLGELKRLMRESTGKTMNLSVVMPNGDVLLSLNLSVPNVIRATWWHEITRQLALDSEIMIIDAYPESHYELIEMTEPDVYDQPQFFLDGKINHCMLDPIKKWVSSKLMELDERNVSKSSSTYSTYVTLNKKIDKFIIEYSNGVPENDVQKIANELRVDIQIDCPFNKEPLIYAESMKKKYRNFRFLNTRLNHVDCSTRAFDNIALIDTNPTICTQQELDEDFKRLTDNNEFCIYQKTATGDNIKSITSIHGSKEVHDPFREAVKRFEQITGLNYCKVDDIKHGDLSKYIQSSCGYNGLIDFWDMSHLFNSEGSPISKNNLAVFKKSCNQTMCHIDMSKAYANFHMCQFYKGFLGKITDFRETDRIQGVGIYTIKNLVIPEGKLKNMNDRMHIYGDFMTYPSPELEMLSHHGCSYEIIAGCWGVNPIDFRFPDEMMENKYYAKWVGCCNSIKSTRRFYMYGSTNYFGVLRKNLEYGNKIVQYQRGDNFDEALVQTPKTCVRHLSHITSFILSYMRMNVLEQLYEFKVDDIIRVHTDGIYFVGNQPTLKNCFREKNDAMNLQIPQNIDGCYSSAHNDFGWTDYLSAHGTCHKWGPARDHHVNELHLGPGGSGKTHYNLTDGGLFRVMYVAPSHKLAREKRIEYGVHSTVWARVAVSDPEKINYINMNANVLIVDEVSMMTDGTKEHIINTYPSHKIIFCGDIGYQLPPIDNGKVFTFSGYTKHHNTVYRTQCPKLLNLQMTLRKMITDECSINAINSFVKESLKSQTISIDELAIRYKLSDMILAGTNENKQIYTELFSGKFADEKYYIEENCRDYCNGDIVITNTKPNVKCSIRHAFTVHSVQGETLKEGNLYIDMAHMFDMRMAYTAISRAKRFEQVHVVVNDKERKYKYPHGKIYVIETKSETYIGSTIQSLEQRMKKHIMDANNYYEKQIGKFITSFPLVKAGGKIRLLEKYPCDTIEELTQREAELIKLHISCVNKTYKSN